MSEYDPKEADIKDLGSNLTPFEQSINKLAKLCDLVPHTLSTSETNQMLNNLVYILQLSRDEFALDFEADYGNLIMSSSVRKAAIDGIEIRVYRMAFTFAGKVLVVGEYKMTRVDAMAGLRDSAEEKITKLLDRS